MSSMYSRTNDLSRTRKSLSDSPPSSPSPTAKNFRHDRASRSVSGGGDSRVEPLGRTGSYTRRENRQAALTRQEEESSSRDYKKMYEEALAENDKLKSRLDDSKQELAKIRTQLHRVNQKQDRISERSTVLESEKREKQALEKKVTDLEEELKVSYPLKPAAGNSPGAKFPLWVPALSMGQLALAQGGGMILAELKSDNQRLKDENGALIRVISKLSK
ncbi:hypothetical protein UPYG_G00007970 [Umbra pygmaea]|uniref:cGMP-dependent protein kinase interacting domain-containing protein n=1 Tax=Umbra pygmaea TaxID=75934 RepID=A0ABD0XKD3_UMBPY